MTDFPEKEVLGGVKTQKVISLLLLSFLLFICTGIHEARADGETQTITVPVTVRITGANEGTPSPGNAIFHFNIWSGNELVPISIVSNAVTTSGFGEFYGSLVFTVPSEYMEDLTTAPLYVQQYDGNADWQFDVFVQDFLWAGAEGFIRPNYRVNYVSVTNIYNPQVVPTQPVPTQPVPTQPAPTEPVPTQPVPTGPAPTEPAPIQPAPVRPAEPPSTGNLEERPVEIREETDKTTFILPVYVGVTRHGGDAVVPAVFHFDLGGMKKDQKYEWSNDAVYTPGEGVFEGTLSFSVPAGEQLEQLVRTGFDVKERFAFVRGWSFSGEVYHVALSREEGALKARILRLRNETTAASDRNLLYFLNYYSMTGAGVSASPASVMGVEDLFRELGEQDPVLLKNTFHIQDGENKWEVSWQARKEGRAVGDFLMTMSYARGEEDYTSVSFADALRVTEEGIFIRLGSIAEAYTRLCGKPFPAADRIPEGEWTAFTQETISWLDLPALDELLRTMGRDAGRAFDVFPAVKTENSYEMRGNREQWESFRALALETAANRHGIWYDLALNAAGSQEMKDLAASYETAFARFREENGGSLQHNSERYPAFLQNTLEQFSSSWQHPDQSQFTFWLSGRFTGGSGRSISVDSAFASEQVQRQGMVTAPENAASGSAFLHELIMMLALDRGSEVPEPETRPEPQTQPLPNQDPGQEADPSGSNNGSDSTLTCYVKENSYFRPIEKHKRADGTEGYMYRGYYYEGETAVIWVYIIGYAAVDLDSVFVYDGQNGNVLVYDPAFYGDDIAGSPLGEEKMLHNHTYSYMFTHQITAEEAKAGECVIKVYACGYEGMNYLTSAMSELKLYTSDEVKPAEVPEPDDDPMFDVRELTQADNWKDGRAFYAPGDKVGFRFIVQNKTSAAWENIEIGTSVQGGVVYTIDRPEPGEEKLLPYSYEVKPEDTEGGSMFFESWMKYTSEDGKAGDTLSSVIKIFTGFREEEEEK